MVFLKKVILEKVLPIDCNSLLVVAQDKTLKHYVFLANVQSITAPGLVAVVAGNGNIIGTLSNSGPNT